MRLRRLLPLVAAAGLASACSEVDSPVDETGTGLDLARAPHLCTEPDPENIPERICELFRGELRRNFLARYDHSSIQFDRGRVNTAQRHMLSTIQQMLKVQGRAQDPPGPETTEEALASLIQDMLASVGLSVDTIPPEALADGKVAVVGPDGGKFVTNNGFEVVVIPPGALNENWLLVITPLDDGSDPLPTGLQQVPKYFDNSLLAIEEGTALRRPGPVLAGDPETVFFDEPVTVALCAVTDDLSPEEEDALRLAHDTGEGVEVLDPVPVPSGIDCDDVVDESSESLSLVPGPGAAPGLAGGKGGPGGGIALAGGRGVGGQVSSFSAFGAVVAEDESATVEGIVFTDDNENGVFDPDSGETTISNAFVEIFCGGEGPEDETFTNVDGFYQFSTETDFIAVGDTCSVEAAGESSETDYSGQSDEFEILEGVNDVDVPAEVVVG